MSERDEYPPGVPCWVDTGQPDPEAAVRFYGELFEWEFIGPATMEGPGGDADESAGQYFVARLRGRDVAGVSSQPAGAPPVPVWNTYVSVESADDAASRVSEAGGSVVVDPFDVLPAGRMAVLADPAGAALCAWEARDREGAQIINDAGAWSMSALNTRDPEGAKAFYGAAFGWATEGFELGGAEITMWRLPGYVGGEPQQPVPRDVIAVMAPMSDDQFPEDVPPHWSVDFWVADVDRTADATTRLGGKVLVPPYDSPEAGLRQAMLADSQGASFSVSKVTAGE